MAAIDLKKYLVKPGTTIDLAERSTKEDAGLTKDEGLALVADLQATIAEQQRRLFAQDRKRVLIVVQAMDTGGKDGLAKSLLREVNPQGIRLASFKAPSPQELSHDYLWRVHQLVPANGELVLFNRSHYEDVLIVRVHDLVPEKVWRRRYGHIRHFEQMLVDEGTTVIKVFLHISKDEQRKRLEARLDDPTKRWKFLMTDVEERKYWDDYQLAFAEALSETSTDDAPWYVVPADRKWFRDLVVTTLVSDVLDGLKLAYPEPADLGDVTID
jgi:PPK2 family polyphosphate:nucleotide phosphotransferase